MSMGYGGMVLGHSWMSGGSSSRKSAVQLLQESKSQYVKSDRVLDSHQEPSRPDHLQISANPNIFLSAPSHTLHVSADANAATLSEVISNKENLRKPEKTTQAKTPTKVAKDPNVPPPIPPRNHITAQQPQIGILTSAALALHSSPQIFGIIQPPPLPSRSPRATPRLRAKTQPVSDAWPRGGDLRRSLSHGPADRGGNDVQMKLRRLLNTDSKESLCLTNTPEHKKGRRGSKNSPRRASQNDDGTFRAELAAVTTYKSLPELILAKALKGEYQQQLLSSPEKPPCERRPSCPGALVCCISKKIKSKSPPPVPPRRNKESLPDCSVKPPPRPPPPKIPIRHHVGDDSGLALSIFSHIADGEASSDDLLSVDDDLDVNDNQNDEEMRRRPILRSKSDVTHERNGILGSGTSNGTSNEWEDESRRSSYCSADIELFFESMGLDGSTLKLLESPMHSGSSPVYFDERASEESGQEGYIGGATMRHQSSSDSDDTTKNTPATNGLIPSGGNNIIAKRSMEPSIIEKNARVIKWLFQCQKARSVVMPRSLSSGS